MGGRRGKQRASQGWASGLDWFRSVGFLYKMLTPMTDRPGRFTMVITIPNHGTYQAMVTATLGLQACGFRWSEDLVLGKGGFIKPVNLTGERWMQVRTCLLLFLAGLAL